MGKRNKGLGQPQAVTVPALAEVAGKVPCNF